MERYDFFKMEKTLTLLFVILLIFPFVTSCKEVEDTNTSSTPKAAAFKGEYENMPNIVQIEMTNGGKIVIELYPDIAPITVDNFKKLVSQKFYDGIIFHRVISGFMIQGGDPKGTGYGGSDQTIKGEFASNGVVNNLSHTRGVISMGRTNVKNSASSQFFIVHKDSKSLDGDYAAFGKVLEGLDVVDQIAAVKVDSNDKPIQEQKIKTVTFVYPQNESNTSAESNSPTTESSK